MSNDPNFHRSVVLVCEHSEDGTFGLILNRPLELHLGDVLEQDDVPPQPISLGGPVQPNTLHYLHRLGDELEESIEVLDGISWGGNFDALRELLRAGVATTENTRLFIGYAGWSAGQLEEEIQADGWIVTPARNEFVFTSDAERLWRSVLRSMGGHYGTMANFPDDPRLN